MVPGPEFYLTLFFIVWLPQELYFALLLLYWIQTKEYRWDRFFIFLKSPDGVKKLEIFWQALKVILSVALLTTRELSNLSLNIYIFLILVFDFICLQKVIKKTIRFPIFTKRIFKFFIAISIVYFAGINLIFLWSLDGLVFPFAETGLFMAIALGWIWTDRVSKNILAGETKEAIIKLKQVKPLVVAITGSYGKSTTKEFVSQLLSAKYKVIKTPSTQNTHFGLVRVINQLIDKNTQIFVAEMGAYKIGEIKNLCSIARPDISILTGIEPQHIELFGSIENIKTAKYEIIDNLKSGGIALFNISNAGCRSLYEKAKAEREDIKALGYYFGTDNVKADISATILKTDYQELTIEISYGKEKHKLNADLKGIHFVENFLAAVLVARLKGVSWEEISRRSEKLINIASTMDVIQNAKGAVVIDDSHNATPAGFEAALKYLKFFSNKKIVVISPGLIELGAMSAAVHKKIAIDMDSIADQILITNKENGKLFLKGIKHTQKFTAEDNQVKIIKKLESKMNKNTVILIEGRVPARIYNYVLTK